MKKLFPLLLRFVVAIILIYSVHCKLTAHPNSVYIFTKVGLEPYGRISIGIIELISGILLFIPKTTWISATLLLGIIGSAIMIHLTILGIEINNDGGMLFMIAIVTFVLSSIILWTKRREVNFF